MDEDSFTGESTQDQGGIAVKLSAERRRDILDNLKREREKRRETVAKGDHFDIDSSGISAQFSEEPKELGASGSSYRSELIGRLMDERRRSSQVVSLESTKQPDSLEKAKQVLQDQIKQEREVKQHLSQTALRQRSPGTPARHKESITRKKGAEKLTYLHDNYVKPPQRDDNTPDQSTQPQKRKVAATRPTSAPPDRSKMLRDELRRQADLYFRENCTFQPKISPLPQSKEHNYSATQGYVDLQQRIQSLSKPKTETTQKREQLKQEQEAKLNKECTFAPRTTTYKSKTTTPRMKVEDRLYLEAQQRALDKERKKRELEELESAAYSFKPQVETSPSKRDTRPPIYKRVRPS
jgi:hypothetical protein